jgi:hypothetical protein
MPAPKNPIKAIEWKSKMKGRKPWNKDKIGVYSEEILEKMRKPKHSGHGLLVSQGLKKYYKEHPYSEEHRQKNIEAHLKYFAKQRNNPPDEVELLRRKRISETEKRIGNNKGQKNGNWINGSSLEEYGSKWDNKLREQIRHRDGFRCQLCFRHQKDEVKDFLGRQYLLCVHHIDYNKKNCDSDNLICLCRGCHSSTTHKLNRSYWIDFFRFYYSRNVEYEIEIPDEVLLIKDKGDSL